MSRNEIDLCLCGSSDNVSAEYLSAANEMGRMLAERGIRLVYGGGKTGLMGAVRDRRACCGRGGDRGYHHIHEYARISRNRFNSHGCHA